MQQFLMFYFNLGTDFNEGRRKPLLYLPIHVFIDQLMSQQCSPEICCIKPSSGPLDPGEAQAACPC